MRYVSVTFSSIPQHWPARYILDVHRSRSAGPGLHGPAGPRDQGTQARRSRRVISTTMVCKMVHQMENNIIFSVCVFIKH